jgi:hypothetical protein
MFFEQILPKKKPAQKIKKAPASGAFCTAHSAD